MTRPLTHRGAPAFALLVMACLALAAHADDWKYDCVHRKKGAALQGLVVEQTARQVCIKTVSRKPGRPTLVNTEWLAAAEVERVELLNDDDREELAGKLKELARERESLAAHLKRLDGKPGQTPLEVVDLSSVPWVGDARVKARSYSSTYFKLVSNARDELVQLAAIQLDPAYEAYARLLPPRVRDAKPATIVLTRTLADYQSIAKDRGLNLTNPAYYDPARNQVVCGSDLERIREETEKQAAGWARKLRDLDDAEAELRKAYKGKVPAELLAPILDGRKKAQAAQARNDEAYTLARHRLFQRLYHEAFHAYLASYVYPPDQADVPRWLNEGLAQVFETAVFEIGQVRVGHADRERLDALRAALHGNKLMPLADVLKAGSREFVVAHGSDRTASERHYLASWALTFYLTFDRKLLGTTAMDDYVKSLKRGTKPSDAFRDLVGQPLADFEKDYLQYLKNLRPDGTSGRR